MADVFERRASLNKERERLWNLIDQTPNLDWLLLTKRPQNVLSMTPWGDVWPQNVWVGTSVENQKLAELRLPYLLAVPATVRFLSCEPLLGPLDLRSWFDRRGFRTIDWVIAGGESGPRSRPMHPDWALALLNQCQRAQVPFHFKQWGHWAPVDCANGSNNKALLMVGADPPVRMIAVGKKLAGRMLKGTTWNNLPRIPHVTDKPQPHNL
jgi:protein gp37